MSIQSIPPGPPTTAGQLAARATQNDQALAAWLGDHDGRLDDLASRSGTSVANNVATFADLPAGPNNGQSWIVREREGHPVPHPALYTWSETTGAWSDPVSVTGSATEAAVIPVIGSQVGLRARNQGAAGDGTTNDLTALTSAATSAVTFGVPLLLDRGATYYVSATLDLPAGLVLDTQGATFRGPTSMNAAVVRIAASDVTVRGPLRIQPGTGISNRGLMVSGAARVRLDDVVVEAPNAGTGWGSNGIQTGVSVVNSTNVRMGRVSISNYDYALTIDGCTDVTIDHLNIATYVRGAYIQNSTAIRVRGGLMHTASSNGSIAPGHNGILIAANASPDATQDITFRDVVIKDAAEHGVRVGGDLRSSRIHFDHCTVVNAGSAGYKVLGNAPVGQFTETVTFTSCVAEDCGILSTSCGWLVEKVVGVTLIAPVVRRRDKTYSAYTGIKLRGCTDVTIIDPLIYDTALSCIGFEPTQGNQTDVQIRGGKLSSNMGHGILIDYTGVTYRRINILGFPVVNIGGPGFAFNVVSGGTGTIAGGPAIVQMTAPIPSDRVVTGNFAGYMAEIHASGAVPASPPQLKNGSVWVDHTAGTRHMRKAGTWTQL